MSIYFCILSWCLTPDSKCLLEFLVAPIGAVRGLPTARRHEQFADESFIQALYGTLKLY